MRAILVTVKTTVDREKSVGVLAWRWRSAVLLVVPDFGVVDFGRVEVCVGDTAGEVVNGSVRDGVGLVDDICVRGEEIFKSEALEYGGHVGGSEREVSYGAVVGAVVQDGSRERDREVGAAWSQCQIDWRLKERAYLCARACKAKKAMGTKFQSIILNVDCGSR